jgi:hypothetical protein
MVGVASDDDEAGSGRTSESTGATASFTENVQEPSRELPAPSVACQLTVCAP